MRRSCRVQNHSLGTNGLVRLDPFVRFLTADPGAAPTGAVPTDPPAGGSGDPAGTDPSGDEPLGESGLKALQRERDARKQYEKDLAEAKSQLKKFEDAQKTDEEKRSERLASAEKTATENSMKALRYEVAAEKGIDLKLAGRLTGATKEELEADADQLITLLGSTPKAPKPDPSQGPRGHTMPDTQPGIPRLAQAFEQQFKSK